MDQSSIIMISGIHRLDGPTMMAAHEYIGTLPQPAFMLGHFVPGAASIGKYIRISSLSPACQEGKFPVVRRPSGGHVLYHAPSDVVYACAGISVKSEITNLLLKGLGLAGIEGFESSKRGVSILVRDAQGEKKLAGSATCGTPSKCLMMHGSIFYDFPDFNVLEQVYGVPAANLQSKITCVREQRNNVSLEELYSTLRSAFAQGRRVIEREFLEGDYAAIRNLASKYASKEYLHGSGYQKDGEPCASTWI